MYSLYGCITHTHREFLAAVFPHEPWSVQLLFGCLPSFVAQRKKVCQMELTHSEAAGPRGSDKFLFKMVRAIYFCI